MKEKTNKELKEFINSSEQELQRIVERIQNPMASDETIRELHRNQNSLMADLQEAKIELASRAERTEEVFDAKGEGAPKPFIRSLNESKIY